MEHIRSVLDQAEEFDAALRGPGTLRDGGDLAIITKSNATSEGRPAALISFSVELPDGSIAKAQTVVPLRMLQWAVRGTIARHGDLTYG